ncbi:alpha/beta hydrolase-fold protein [Rhizohabitans arisaemae]|uniref:alpha/beta hydrolase-fold protein n=1 Tax=Rhizohabitans arisaemae TaxID=2720610 RepID=UPI0024B04FCA|nr:alpha/beta hydrolase-fold protein [Rhizohabitans arisaemae]
MTQTLESPRLTRFLTAVENGEAGAADALVDDLKAAGGPFLDEQEDGSVLVTFVYVGQANTVHLKSQVTADADGRGCPMTRVPGTDVWHFSARITDRRLSATYFFQLDDPMAEMSAVEVMQLFKEPAKVEAWLREAVLGARHDPYNSDESDQTIEGLFQDEAQSTLRVSVLNLPDVDPATWFGPPRLSGATLHTHTLRSEILGNERKVVVYLPPVPLPDSGDRPVVIVQDGDGFLSDGFDHILTNLIAGGEVPPFVGVFVYNPTVMSRMEEMSCQPAYAAFCADELMPWLRRTYGVTADPARTVVSGCSYGGLASAWLGYSRPDVFGRVLSMSGSLWWGKTNFFAIEGGPLEFGRDDEPQWLNRRFAAEPRKPVRFWIDAGTLEVNPLDDGVSLLSANRNLRTVLGAKGYEVRYHEFSGGHDNAGWRRSFPLGLRYLLGA